MDESSAAAKILARADRVLTTVDESFIVRVRNNAQRSMPNFRPEEISLGPELGRGGFGVVNEISKFTLDDRNEMLNVETEETAAPDDSQDNNNATRSAVICIDEESGLTEGSHVHYDVRKARYLMTKMCQRRGNARYALKRLHSQLTDLERARGMVDLAVEAKYLSIVWHPNISK